ncbi:sigma-54-dependent Fis family transcriptional regulator [Simkania negevensis]|uniref:Sigma-54-dependent Fis family transcriptional regulator n=1 Tax=Simkania negevensis TaxID=83561 RepID=A0ABS3ARN4_9BACT|nr:sigma-54-dependent Fis family transcriptional regulator [Simkania negevensis]
MKAKILIIDDEESILQSLQQIFDNKGYRTATAANGKKALDLITSELSIPFVPDIVLLDILLPDINGLALLRQFKEIIPEASIMMITAYGSVPQCVEAMRHGAIEYILKPFNIDELLIRVEREIENRKLKDQVEFLSRKAILETDKAYVEGESPRMQTIYDHIDKIAASTTNTVFIHGETGTGKEMVASRIHVKSSRRNKPFVEINITALTGELLESELFGHEKGSFTGALRTKKGLFEVAHGGTLFLDEIGDMDLSMQAKILRALQERKIRRVGSTENIDIDIRLITATNKNLSQAVQERTFREDLFYRLNVVPIHLPPLRERKEDIPALVHYFVQLYNKEFHREVVDVDKEVFTLLTQYNWPGNIREMKNLIERTMLLEVQGQHLQVDHFAPYIKGGQEFNADAILGNDDAVYGSNLPPVGTQTSLADLEKKHIERVLQANNGNKNQSAQILGIDRTTLYNKIKKYNINV